MDAEDSQGSSARAATIRRHLAEQLPGYMVPAVVMRVGALPLTPNGKIDRHNLPPLPAALPSAILSRSHGDWSGANELKDKLDGLLREQRGDTLTVTRIAKSQDI